MVTYEFVVETLDYYDGCGSDPDIIDCPAFETLEEAAAFAKKCDDPWRIALRRDAGNEAEGLVDRHYAYPDEKGILPDRMESATDAQDGPGVPKRFRAVVFPVPRLRAGFPMVCNQMETDQWMPHSTQSGSTVDQTTPTR